MKIWILSLLLFTGSAFVGCPRGPLPVPVPIPPDGSDGGYQPPPPPHPTSGSPEARACANLKTLHCPEGEKADCAEALAAGPGKTFFDLPCLERATTAGAARACGNVRCP